MPLPPMDAIVLRDVVKSFRKSTIRGEYTTFKSELVRWLRGQRRQQPDTVIEALRGINLTIPRGKTVGIIGRNGSGKSTLLKLITGIYSPSSGSVEINGRISALLDLGAGFHPDFSGRENILINGVILGLSRTEIRERMDEIIAFSELGEFIDEPVRTYSSGMYMRLAFAVATHVDPEILIIDEILAVGDEHFSRKSLQKMTDFQKSGKTIVIVTHDLGTLERWCDLAAWIDGGRIREVGAPAEVIRHYKQAVKLAEARGNPLLAPALSADGGALPELVLTPRVADQAHLRLGEVRLLTREGLRATEVDTEDSLELQLEFSTQSEVTQGGFGWSLLRDDGSLVYETSTLVDGVPLPKPLPAQGMVRLRLERLGLMPGQYKVAVSALAADGTPYESRPEACTFKVRSSLADQGITRLPHRWELLTHEAAVPSSPEKAISA
ncbi:ABC transporter ATP-binding protein [Cystobacter fuscus]|uniref:ABC transporter ATP-binding protein n=1 Tax=Cystobacter fuscus TaxID=43 RepID=A0A250JAG7_9BACT|nr:ABC transporter ATP-binding protein [Cystobacter fuscus]ATB40570.1 ABC transporter ATP-binding protein [Cystobacter fuscus]